MTIRRAGSDPGTVAVVPVGDCQREFAAAAAADGIELSAQRFSWICQQGHFGLPEDDERPEIEKARELLSRIYLKLGGDEDVLAAGRPTALGGDFLHEPTGTLIEIDEEQHFTSARLTTLGLYPESLPLGFSLAHYKALCRKHRLKSDRYRAAKEARGFGPGGRTKQRAYYDALRDVAAPALGHPPLVRIDAVYGNGAAAYRTHRERLRGLLGLA
jgi:hypothetical protein